MRSGKQTPPPHTYAVHKCLFLYPSSVFLCGLHTETHTHTNHIPATTYQEQQAHIFLTKSLTHLLATNLVVSLLSVCEYLRKCGCKVSCKGMFCLIIAAVYLFVHFITFLCAKSRLLAWLSRTEIFSAIQGRLGQTVPLYCLLGKAKHGDFFWFEGELDTRKQKEAWFQTLNWF